MLRLSDVLLDSSVLLWGAFARSQIGGSVFKDFGYNGEESYWPIGCKLLGFPCFQDKDYLGYFPSCWEVPFEQDYIP
jgi:hypothetical protein